MKNISVTWVLAFPCVDCKEVRLAKRKSLSSHFEGPGISLHVMSKTTNRIFFKWLYFFRFLFSPLFEDKDNNSVTSMIYRILLIITLVTMETSADVQFS